MHPFLFGFVDTFILGETGANVKNPPFYFVGTPPFFRFYDGNAAAFVPFPVFSPGVKKELLFARGYVMIKPYLFILVCLEAPVWES